MNLFQTPWLRTQSTDRFSFSSRNAHGRRPASWRRARAAASAVQASHVLSERSARMPADAERQG